MKFAEACKPKSTSLPHGNRPTRNEYNGKERCKPFGQSKSHNPGAHVDPYGSSRPALPTEEAQLWICPACTTRNKTDFRTCQVCQSWFQESAKVDPHAQESAKVDPHSRTNSHPSEGLVEWDNSARMSSSQSQEGSSSSSGKESSWSRFTGWNDSCRNSTDSDPGARLTSPPSSNSPLIHDVPCKLQRQRSHTKTVLQVRLEEEARAWQTYHEITEEYRRVRKHIFTHRSMVLIQHVSMIFVTSISTVL